MRIILPLVFVFVVPAAACSVIPSQRSPEAADRAAPMEDGVFPMPDVTGMTRADAEAHLRAKGVLGTISIDETYVCDEPNVKELNICFTQPRAGTPTRAKIPVVLYPRQKGTATYPMPELKGKTADEARAILMKLGQIEQRLDIEEMNVLMPDCEAHKVCRQDPKAGVMTNERERKTLRIAPAE